MATIETWWINENLPAHPAKFKYARAIVVHWHQNTGWNQGVQWIVKWNDNIILNYFDDEDENKDEDDDNEDYK